MREIRFRALVEYEGTGKAWEYYTTLTQPIWLDRSIAIVHQKDLQYTGLKDKNGKEIYEGDVLMTKERRANFPLKWVVVYNEEQTGFRLRWEKRFTNNEGGFYDILISSNEYEQFEVIGNIYENSNLLKEKTI